MNEPQSNNELSKSITETSLVSIQTQRYRVQDYSVIWADENIDQNNLKYQDALLQLRSIVDEVKLCTTIDKCMTYLHDDNEETVFLIVSRSLGKSLIPEINDMSNLNSIFIYYTDQHEDEQWTKTWKKVTVHTSIEAICQVLQHNVNLCNHDSTFIQVAYLIKVVPSLNIDRSERKFMHSQMIIEILLNMNHCKEALQNFVTFCKKIYHNNSYAMKLIDEFECTYQPSQAMWWYTNQSIIYKMLNRALRIFNIDIIIRTGFFVNDIHQQIVELHQQQINQYQKKYFTVYRAQRLSTVNLEKIIQNTHGLLSFNNFLSTNTNRDMTLEYVRNTVLTSDEVSVLFDITIDSTISTPLFASIQDVSCFKEPNEILLSICAIFRIVDINKLDNVLPIYQVVLRLTSNENQYICQYKSYIREKILGTINWHEYGRQLLQIGNFSKAQTLYMTLITNGCNDIDEKRYCSQLCSSFYQRGKVQNVISFYEEYLKMKLENLPDDHVSLAFIYSSMGAAYEYQGDYLKSYDFYEKSLKIKAKYLPSDYLSLATSYNNIAGLLKRIGDYSMAVQFYEKELDITKKFLHSNHIDLAIIYNNISILYEYMDDYSKSLSYLEEAFTIRQQSLSTSHPSIKRNKDDIARLKKKL